MQHRNTPEQDRWAEAVWITAQTRMALNDMHQELRSLPPLQRLQEMIKIIKDLESRNQEWATEWAKIFRKSWGLENV